METQLLTELAAVVMAVGDLLEHGDRGAHRLIVWIAHALHADDRLTPDQQLLLARCAGEAAHRSRQVSLALLAVPVLDHALKQVVDGSFAVPFGEVEEMNMLRQDLTDQVSRIPYDR
jgi:hypothetical protein